MKKWIGAGALVAVAGLAAPWGVGALTEQQWHQAEAQLSEQPMVSMTTRQYERGYGGAEVAGSFQVQHPETGETLSLPYQGRISHGLWGSDLALTFGDSDDTWVQTLFPGERPSLDARFQAWGSADLRFVVPAIEATDDATGETVTSSELVVTGNVRDQGNAFDLALDWPGLVATGPGATVTLNRVSMSQAMSRLEGDVWIGDAVLRLDALTARQEGSPEVTAQGLTVTSTSEADAGGERFTGQSSLALDKVTAEGESAGPFRLEFALRELEVDAWNRLLNAFTRLQTMSLAPEQGLTQQQRMAQQMSVIDSLNQGLRDLAAAGLSFGFPSISLTFPEGEVTGELMLSHPTLNQEEADQLGLVMQRLSGHMALTLPVALVESQPALMAELAPLVEQGMVVRDGDVYRVDARLQDLELDVNGQVFPLPPMI